MLASGSPAMDFLLECIGFPPSTDLAALAQRIRREGEPVALRGPRGEHLRVPFPGRLEVRLDREEGEPHDSLWPCFEATRRLRVAVEHLQALPDSPFDVLLTGRANPPLPSDPEGSRSENEYRLAACLWDARKLPPRLPRGHVLAVSLAGFALDVDHVGPPPREEDEAPALDGARLAPLAGEDAPGGCMQLALQVLAIHHLENPFTHERIELVEAAAPGRPLDLFLSRWQLEAEGLPAPRPGWRIEGTFLLTGRVAGGLPLRRVRP
jgi:hypothetical protein